MEEVECWYEEVGAAPDLQMSVDECKEPPEHDFCVNLFYLLDCGGLQKVVEQSLDVIGAEGGAHHLQLLLPEEFSCHIEDPG